MLDYHAIRSRDHWKDLVVSQERAMEIEKETRVQAESPTWFDKKPFTSAPTSYGQANVKNNNC